MFNENIFRNMSNIIDSIRLSGTTYQIQGSGGGITVDPTLDSGSTNPVANSAITTALDDKQATLVSSQNIKTINNESILGSGNIDIQGGSTYTAGRGISIANDTISFDLPIYKTVSGTAFSLVLNTSSEPSANTFKTKYNTYINCEKPYVDNNSGDSNLIMGEACSAMSYASQSFVGGYLSKIGDMRTFAFGLKSEALAVGAVAFGYDGQSFKPQVSKGYGSFACGGGTSANTQYSFATGYHTFTTRRSEFASGQYNNSVSATTTFGDSGNTLFSVGNGTADNARHNAFEIRQNGDIYLTKDGQDVKLQDQLGGGGGITSGEVQSMIDESISGKANSSDAAYEVAATTQNDGIYFVTYDKGGSQIYYSFEPQIRFQAPLYSDYDDGKVKISGVTAITSASTDNEIPSAKAVNDKLGGLSLVKLTQAEYDALATKDNNTLYVIVN